MVVITNKAQAGVLNRADKLGIPTEFIPAQDFTEGRALEVLHRYQTDFIALAGFLLRVPDDILHDYPNKIVNIHPALLPKFGGKGMYGNRVHEAVIAAAEKRKRNHHSFHQWTLRRRGYHISSYMSRHAR